MNELNESHHSSQLSLVETRVPTQYILIWLQGPDYGPTKPVICMKCVLSKTRAIACAHPNLCIYFEHFLMKTHNYRPLKTKQGKHFRDRLNKIGTFASFILFIIIYFLPIRRLLKWIERQCGLYIGRDYLNCITSNSISSDFLSFLVKITVLRHIPTTRCYNPFNLLQSALPKGWHQYWRDKVSNLSPRRNSSR